MTAALSCAGARCQVRRAAGRGQVSRSPLVRGGAPRGVPAGNCAALLPAAGLEPPSGAHQTKPHLLTAACPRDGTGAKLGTIPACPPTCPPTLQHNCRWSLLQPRCAHPRPPHASARGCSGGRAAVRTRQEPRAAAAARGRPRRARARRLEPSCSIAHAIHHAMLHARPVRARAQRPGGPGRCAGSIRPSAPHVLRVLHAASDPGHESHTQEPQTLQRAGSSNGGQLQRAGSEDHRGPQLPGQAPATSRYIAPPHTRSLSVCLSVSLSVSPLVCLCLSGCEVAVNPIQSS
jgi:hypothetical protein